MPEILSNLRRQFRNRFEVYADYSSFTAAAELDGSVFTLLDLCVHLRHDPEPFPRHYDVDLRRIMARTGSQPIRAPLSYGDVAQLIEMQLAERTRASRFAADRR